ncbi:hypothetical protein CHU98_g4263 [Xylaria longipes]|nr:hypothetical protein CHU98_g4263 [Xylaria longipes]
MRFHTLVAAIAAAGTVAETNLEVTRQKGQAATNVIRIPGQAPAPVARPRPNFHALSTRRASLKTDYDDPLITLSRREDDDDEDDEDGDEEDDEDGDEDDKKDRRRPNTAASKSLLDSHYLLISIPLSVTAARPQSLV